MDLMNQFAGKEWKLRLENGLVGTVGKGKNGMNGESSIDIYTLPCVKQIAGEKLLYETGSPAWPSLMT